MRKSSPVAGLTGNIGSGKSAVAGMLDEFGAAVIDADVAAREVTASGTRCLKSIVERFGAGVLNQDGTLDRRALRELVFDDADARRDLESMLHPAIMSRVAQLTAEVGASAPLIVWVAPLLFEANMHTMVNKRWLVTADEQVRLERIVERDRMDRELALKMIRAQMPQEQKIPLADEVIDNNGSLEETRRRVEALWRRCIDAD